MRETARRDRRGLPPRRLALALAFGALISFSILILYLAMPRTTPVASPVSVLLTVDRTLFHRLGLNRLTYVRSLARAGASVRVLDEAALRDGQDERETARRLLEGVHGLVLSGGGDVSPDLYGGGPEGPRAAPRGRDRLELALLAEADRRNLPVLGICRGAQLINVARGGTLRTIRSDEALQRRHGRMRWHPVELEPESRLAELFGTNHLGRVVSYHGQAVETPGVGIAVVGTSDDGVAEAIENALYSEGAWLVGVQWHPELSPRSELQRRLFEGLVAAARARRDREAGSTP